MPFAAFNGLEVLFATFAGEESLYSGEDVRSASNKLLSTVQPATKMLRWNGTTVPYTDATWAPIQAQIDLAAGFVTCTGDAFGATYVCKVKVTAMPYERATRSSLPPHGIVSTGFERTYAISIEQAE